MVNATFATIYTICTDFLRGNCKDVENDNDDDDNDKEDDDVKSIN